MALKNKIHAKFYCQILTWRKSKSHNLSYHQTLFLAQKILPAAISWRWSDQMGQADLCLHEEHRVLGSGSANFSSSFSNPPGSLLTHSCSGQVISFQLCKDLGIEGWDRQRTHRRERSLVAFMPFMPAAPWDLIQEFFNRHFQEHVRACWANLPNSEPDTWLTFAPFPPFISVA